MPDRPAIVRRSVQVTCAASTGFLVLLHGFGQPVAALYALFAPIALGLLSAIPGTGRTQAFVALGTLPLGALLAALGTALAVSTAAAVTGMLVTGFLLSFAAVAGPRPAGAAPALQLFYILACFPPYAPGTLGARLTGLAVGVVLIALCQACLLPGPPDESYRERLADALETAAAAVTDPAHTPAAHLRDASEALRPSRVAPGERPAGPGRRDRALSHAGAAARRILDQLASWTARSGPPAAPDRASAALLDRVARMCAATGTALRAGGQPPAARPLEEAIRRFQAQRVRGAADPGDDGPAAGRQRRQAAVLALAESTWIAVVAVGVAAGGHRPSRRTPAPPPHEFFWYAGLPAPRLWARRIAGNLTPRSVLFQNAVRVACGLAVARLVAGTLDLTHGFWVLLAVLTLGRTTAGATWRAVRQAMAGTLAGAVVAGALLIALGGHQDVYAALLVPGMLTAFTLGPLLGIAYAQGLFTLVVSLVFAQIAPTTWQLSEARIVDVVTGSAIGLLCGLLAWPAGARREVHRTMASLLRSCGALIPGTVDALLPAPGRRPAPPETLPTLNRLRLAETAFAQFCSEPPANREGVRADWHAVLVVAYSAVLGAQRLPRFETTPAHVPREASAWTRGTAAELAADAGRIAALFGRARSSAPARAPHGPPPWHGPVLPAVVDLEMWLMGLGRQLARIERSLSAPNGPSGQAGSP
ncbi:FUSC family protein [Streptomyces sp. NPDC001843]|uniref:FUSC family protein n=1 Tax=Streptomyces sp. NPDC001843 TaxID=3364617 RepID=UPI0036CC013F